jgi:PEP-CTERM motif
MKLNHIVAAAALLAVGAANAALSTMDGVTVNGDSSVLLVMLDSTGATTQGLTLDLGYNFRQANYSGAGAVNTQATTAWNAPNTQINWDFANNTVTLTDRQTGASSLVSGPADNAWNAQVSTFLANANASEVKFALVAGSQRGSTASSFLATGTPTAAELSSQNAAATGSFPLVNPLFTTNATQGTHNTSSNGAYAMAATDGAYVGGNTTYGPTDVAGWRNNLKWNGWTVLGGQTNLRQLNSTGQEFVVGNFLAANGYDVTGLLNQLGTFSVAADGLSAQWMTASAVPEPSTYAMTLLGLVAVAALARRRRA